MELVDVRTLPEAARLAAADLIRQQHDFALPTLTWFNTDPCPRHASLDEGMAVIPPCRHCGIRFRRHQRIGIAWLFMRGRGLIADQVGTGKTPQAAGLLAAMKQVGELDRHRALVIVRAAALGQWVDQLTRFLPRLHIISGTGTRAERINKYCSAWEVCVISSHTFIRDHEMLDNLPINALIADDVDPLRNPESRTACVIKRLAYRCARVVLLTGTPLQKRLVELHSILEPLGGLELFGPLSHFKRRYLREELVSAYSPRAGRVVTTKKITGHRNLDEFIGRLRPMVLRRTPDHIDDVDLPAITPNTVWLDLTHLQRQRYELLRQGVLKLIRAEGIKVKQTTAATAFTYGAQICAGLNTLDEPDGPNSSVKLNWVEDALVDGDLSDEKVVVFCRFTKTIEALSARLHAAGVGHGIIWGRQRDKEIRQATVNRFWDDPACRVLLGTEAIEQSLNLQVARHLINVDQLMNPARMQQLAGRIRRDGSAYRTVYVHNLLTRNTQEESYLDILAREQALADHVWGESNDLYEALSPLQLLQLIGTRT